MGRLQLLLVFIMCVLVPAYDCRINCRGRKCKDICAQPRVTGRCRAAFPRFYYNPTAQACTSFTYGGCGGNENNFKTVGECQRACAGSARADCQSESMKCSNMMLGIGMLVPESHTPEGLKKMCSAVGEIKTCFDAVVASCPEMTKAAEQMKSSMNHFEQTCGYLGTEGETVSSQYQTECDAYGGGHGPCKHGATCESDPVTRAAICNCAGTGYTGRLCEGYTMETTTKKPEITARCPTYKSWPKLVGQSFEKAKARILHDCPKVHVQKSHHHGGMTTLEWNINRVRVYVNHSGMVVSVLQRA